MENEMKVWKQHKYLITSTIAILTIVALIFIFQEQLYYPFGLDNYISIHLIIEFFIVFFSMTIAVQTWLGSRFSPNYQMILMGGLFLVMGILEGVHTLTYSQMPFFVMEHNSNLSLWLTTMQQFLLPIGFIVIYSLKSRNVGSRFALSVFSISFAISIGIIIAQFAQWITLPNLLTVDGEPTEFIIALHYVMILLEIAAIAVVLWKRQLIQHNVPLIVMAFVCLILSECTYILYSSLFDLYIFLAHIFHLIAFVTLFFSMYFTQVRVPFIELKKAHESLAQSQIELRNIAYYDAQTGLKNEQYLKEYLQSQLKLSKSNALIVFGVERYTAIKSSLGNGQIDNLIQKVSERMVMELNNQYTLFKIESDRFAVFVPSYKEQVDITELTQRLQRVMEEPFVTSHYSISSGLNFGVSTFPEDAKSVDELLQNALFALYEAQDMKTSIAFYSASMQKTRENRIQFEHDLKDAINGQLFLEYQPQLDLNSKEISSMEALIRWQHPEKGRISPLDFIPIAEETGLIIPIGKWALETACRETIMLQQKIGKQVRVAVNLSVGQLYQDGFVDFVERILQETEIKPENLQLEITESMTINLQQIIPILQKLKELGVTISIDDFGTGYSSLSYLKDIPLDELKIDRSFISHITDNEQDAGLVKMILSMAKHLNLNVVAEGIETKEQLHYLKQHTCDKIQGFYISKPIPMSQLAKNYQEIEVYAKQSMREVRESGIS